MGDGCTRRCQPFTPSLTAKAFAAAALLGAKSVNFTVRCLQLRPAHTMPVHSKHADRPPRLRSERKDLAGVEDVFWVQRLLDGAHHGNGPLSAFLAQKVLLVDANAVLARAGAFHGNRTEH